MLIFFKRFHFSGTNRGFTLIELLVVLAIMTIMTTLILFQHRSFDSSTLLRSLTYSVALSIRQAQVYGTSVRQFGTGSGSFNYSYGVYFSSGDASHYQLFADVNGDKLRASNGSEDVNQFTLGTGYSIVKFCATISGGSQHCSTGASPITSLTIYFRRPNPDARFSSSASSEVYSDAYIQIVGPSGVPSTRSISVTSTGQISVGALGS